MISSIEGFHNVDNLNFSDWGRHHRVMPKMMLVSNHCAQLILVNNYTRCPKGLRVNSLFGNKAKERGTLDCYSSSCVVI